MGCRVMGVHQKKVAVHDLRVGMFVSDLDRPWHQTPFPIQGFYIRNEEEIRALISYCRTVYVDVPETRGALEDPAGSPTFSTGSRRSGEKDLQLPPVQIRNPRHYEASSPLPREVKQAEKMVAEVQEALHKVYANAAVGEPVDAAATEKAAESMVRSIIRNPDALIWLTRVRHRDEYTFSHSLNTAVWALVFGRALGLQPDVLKQLGTGALLCHIGKAKLPQRLLRSETELAAEELAAYRSYVETGAQMLEAAGMAPIVVSVVRYHRERHNGNGFPQGVMGTKIPLLAKLAGLADHYESMIEPREDVVPLSPAQAVARLYESRNRQFQEDLVERFIQAIGVYPTGTVVALSDNQVGVVLSHRPHRRLWPKVMVMTDQNRVPLKDGKIIDLAEHNEGKSTVDALQIAGCLPFGLPGLDPAAYGVSGSGTRWSWRQLVS